MIDAEDWAEIRRLHRAEQMPIRANREASGNLAEHGAAGPEERSGAEVSAGAKGAIVDAVEPQIRELLQRFPEMPATVIAERIGWNRSYAVVRRRCAAAAGLSGGGPGLADPPRWGRPPARSPFCRWRCGMVGRSRVGRGSGCCSRLVSAGQAADFAVA